MARECDFCKVSPAFLFCRADSAFLCSHCDSNIHGANKLASRHERVWICEVCEQAPAAFTCKADAAVLCATCDADVHSANLLSVRHERVPITPFFDSPSPNMTRKGRTTGLIRKNRCQGDHHDVGDVDEEEVEDDDDDNEEEEECNNEDGNKEESDAVAEAEAASWLIPNDGGGVHSNVEIKYEMKPSTERMAEQYYFPEVDPYLDLDYAASMDPKFYRSAAADSIVPVQNRNITAPAAGMAVGVAAMHHHHPPPFISNISDRSYDIDITRSSNHSYSYAPSVSHSVRYNYNR